MSATLFQILIQGEEDKHLMSEGFDSLRPFRQVYRRQTLFATEYIDIDARYPTSVRYGQTLSNIQIPRRGDLLRGIMIGMKVKRASGTTKFPAIELIDEISMWSGKTLLERVRGDWIFVEKHLTESTDGMRCVDRMTGFQTDETQGSIKELYVEIPFFTRKTPIPLIALQMQNLHLELKLKEAPVSLDPTYQPDIDILCEYIVVDDDERRYYTKNAHELLVERVQTQEDVFDMRQSVITKLYTTVNESLGGYDRVTGSGSGQTILLGDRIKLVENPTWTGRTDVLYDQEQGTVRYTLKGRFSMPTEGTVGFGWAAYTLDGVDHGYALEFSTQTNILTATLKRDGNVVCVIGNDSITSSVYASVSGESTSTDYTPQQSAGEAWLLYDIVHDLEQDSLTFIATVEGYVSGGFFAPLPPVNSRVVMNHVIREGYTPVDTSEHASVLSVFADSTYDVFYVPITTQSQIVQNIPVSDNYQTLSIPYYFRGPIRYLVWWYRRDAANWTFGKTSTDVVNGESIRHDILHSARILLNGKERTRLMPSQFFTVFEAKRLFGKGLPSGVHVYGYAEGRIDGIDPNGTMNHSRLGDVRIQHVLRSYNTTQTNIIRLDESESLAESSTFNRIVCAAVGYNIFVIENGRLFVAYV